MADMAAAPGPVIEVLGDSVETKFMRLVDLPRTEIK